MPNAEALPPDVLNAIASKLGDHLPRLALAGLAATTPSPHATLNETFPVWFLGASDTIQPTHDLSKLAVPTGRWHHQIKLPGLNLAYARSMPFGADPSTWSVRQISASKLAQQIDDAINWIDANVTDDHLTARLLVVPAFHVNAFWLIDPANPTNQVVVVISASSENTPLATHKAYTSQEFVNALRASRHVEGLRP